MINLTPVPSPTVGDNPDDIELFCLELDHQIKAVIKPAIQAALDRKQRIFDATIKCLAKPAPKQGKTRRGGKTRKRAGSSQKCRKRDNCTKRRRHKAKPAFVRDLAARLAGHWQAPLILDARIRPAG